MPGPTCYDVAIMLPSEKAHSSCTTCGAELQGSYCSTCGEPAVHPGDLSLRHLTHDFAHEFTHVDGKIWRTLRALVLQPGKLTAEYWAGRRGLWIRPLRIYLIMSALTLLLAANAAGPLGFRIWVNGANHYSVGTSPDRARGAAPLNNEMTHRVQSIYLWARYLSLVIFAAAGVAAYRKQQPYFGAQLIFGMHYYSFEYLLTGVIARAWPGASPSIAIAIGFGYLVLSVRRVYGQGWFRTVFKSMFLYTAVMLGEVLTVGGSVFAVVTLWK